MSVTVVADLSVKDEELEWVKGWLLQAITAGPGKIDGFEAAELLLNKDDPNNLVIWQKFTTRDHHASYMKSSGDHYSAEDAQRYFASFLRPPNVHYYDTVS